MFRPLITRSRCRNLFDGVRQVRRGYASLTTSTATSPPTPPTPSSSPSLLTLDYSTLNSYSQTYVPTTDQLKHAHHYFASHRPSFLFSAPAFRAFPPDSLVPEVAFLGRSNVGKSSLLNALFNRAHGTTNLAHVSQKPGKTRTMNCFGIGQQGSDSGAAGGGVSKILKPGMSAAMLSKRGGERQSRKDEVVAKNWVGRGGLIVVDCPGYGFASREKWGTEVLKYLQNRTQLRRAFVLVDSEHGLKQTDRDILGLLRESGTPHQLLLSKVDKILYSTSKEPSPVQLSNRLVKLQKICDDIRKEVKPKDASTAAVMGDILCFSSAKYLQGSRMGIDGIRWAVLQSCGLV